MARPHLAPVSKRLLEIYKTYKGSKNMNEILGKLFYEAELRTLELYF